MFSPDYSKRDYLLPNGCKDLIDLMQLKVSEQTSVADLAKLLGQKPAQIMTDLMFLGVFATIKQFVSFEVVRQIAQKYGYTVKRSLPARG